MPPKKYSPGSTTKRGQLPTYDGKLFVVSALPIVVVSELKRWKERRGSLSRFHDPCPAVAFPIPPTHRPKQNRWPRTWSIGMPPPRACPHAPSTRASTQLLYPKRTCPGASAKNEPL